MTVDEEKLRTEMEELLTVAKRFGLNTVADWLDKEIQLKFYQARNLFKEPQDL